ncbi:hypothetical protein COY27_05905 [Candidatus Woesearchaeota archaeon CG_4_10_14_0_2_um_filter_33_13]|nr:MAG: hypothetical protein COY27_05905 [Candidatus Woesearchaeota archaeon CG_4_10_14_0_2_um_filter_33_13]
MGWFTKRTNEKKVRLATLFVFFKHDLKQTYPLHNQQYLLARNSKLIFNEGEPVQLNGNRLDIGHDQILTRSISREHALLLKGQNGKFTIRDNSTYGSRVNGLPITKGVDHILEDEDKITLGESGSFLLFQIKYSY